MAKRNIRNVLRRSCYSDCVSINAPSGLYEFGKAPNTYAQTDAYHDPELMPHCISSFCYLCLFVWLLLDKNYNRLLDRNALPVIATCYVIEVVKFACHSYLVGKMTSGHTWAKMNPIFWTFQFAAYTVLSIAIAFATSILFGAPLTSKHEQTFVFSALITAVLVTPTTVQIGSNMLPLLLTNCIEAEIFGSVEAYAKNNFHATILGAFVGTAVIPFDWETEWQRWPIPCSVTLIVGHLAANVYEIICWQLRSVQKYSE